MGISFSNLTPYIAFDTECTGLDFHHGDVPFAVSACDYEGNTYFWEWAVDPSTRDVVVRISDLDDIQDLLDTFDSVVFHNAKFDIAALSRIAISVPFEKVQDTIIAHHVLDSTESHKLDDLAAIYLEVEPLENDLRAETVRARAEGKRRGWALGTSPQGKAEVPRDYWMCKTVDPESTTLQDYAEQDVTNTALLWNLLATQIQKDNLVTQYNSRMALVPVVYDMERRGVTISKSRMDSEILRYGEVANDKYTYLQKVGTDALDDGPFNPNSGAQLIDLLYDYYDLPELYYTKTGKPSVDKDTLEELQEHTSPNHRPGKFLQNLLEMKKHETSLRYLRSYASYAKRELGIRLFPSINITGTKTTRFSSSNPNSQNVGKGDEWETEDGTDSDFKLRDIFGPMKNRIWYSIDYNQLQLRILAYASEDQTLIKAFEEGYDFHAYVASRIFNKAPEYIVPGERRIAKNVNFGIIFGAGEAKIDATCGVPGLYQSFRSLFPSVDKYMSANTRQVRKKGCVNTLGGYRLWVPRDKPYKGTNYIIQGTEGEIVQLAMVDCHKYLQEAGAHLEHQYQSPYICLQVHDELVFDFPKAGQDNYFDLLALKEKMEDAGEFYGVTTPVEVEVITHKWSEGKPFTTLPKRRVKCPS